MVKICMIIYFYERMGAFLRTEWLSLNNKKKNRFGRRKRRSRCSKLNAIIITKALVFVTLRNRQRINFLSEQ